MEAHVESPPHSARELLPGTASASASHGDSTRAALQVVAGAATRGDPRRVVQLLLFGFLSASNAILWITFAPIATIAQEYYGVGNFAINCFSMIFMAAYVPFCMPAAAVIENNSLRRGLLMGGVLNLVGALTRVLPRPFVGGAVTGVSFAFAMLGQFLASVAQTFILATPPKVARNWFPPSEVVTATSVGALCNQAGIAIGFYLSPLVLQEQASRMPFVMLVEAAVAAAALVLVVAFFRSDPHDEAPLAARTPAASPRAHVAQPQPDHPQPPAASLAPSRPSAAPQLAAQAPVGLRTLRALLTDPHNRHFLVLTFSYGLGVGVFYAISTLMGQALDVVHYSASDSGLLGVVLVLGGLAGSVTAGAIADRVPDKKRKVLLLSLWASAFSLVWYSLENRSDNLSRLLAVCAVMGFFMTAVIPVGLDVGVEATFPVPETASSTTLLLSAQLFGIALITALSFVPAGRVFLHTVNWALTGGGVVAAGVLFFFRAEYRRSLYEHEHYAAAP